MGKERDKIFFNWSRRPDALFLFMSFLLLFAGLLVLYSASTVESFKVSGYTSYYFLQQLKQGGVLGILAFIFCLGLDYKYWLKLIPFLVVLALVSLVLVKVPGIGVSFGGATRWISLGPIVFQPSELAKFVVVLYLAAWLSKRGEKNQTHADLLPALITLGLFALLILWQPDMGTMLVLISVAFSLLFLGGVPLRKMGILVLGAIGASGLLIKLEPYRVRRILTFLNPALDPLGIGYHVNQALLAIGAGGIWGAGYGLSKQKYNYLPEAIGDSIFAVLAEELGFVRTSIVMLGFLILILRGVFLSLLVGDRFGKLLGSGLMIWIGVQVLINVGAMIGVLPLTGITLPLFSYGSSSLIVTMAALGVVGNISTHRIQK